MKSQEFALKRVFASFLRRAGLNETIIVFFFGVVEKDRWSILSFLS